MNFFLSNQIAFRIYEDFTILLHHETHKCIRLNRSAGEIIERIANAKDNFSTEEIEFIKALKQQNIVVDKIHRKPLLKTRQTSKANEPEPVILNDLNNYAKAKMIPLNCQIELSYRCSLKCKHCYLGNEIPKSELSTATIKKFIDELAEMGGLFLTLTGGEIFLRYDLEEIYLHARKRHFAVSILTSGWNVSEELLTRLAGYGMDTAQVSIHGYDKLSHDAFTIREGSFENAFKTLEKLKALGVQVRAAISVHKENFGYIDKILEILKEQNIKHNFNLNMLPTLSGENKAADLQLAKKQLMEIIKINPVRSKFRMQNLSHDDFVCGAGRSTISLDPFGNVYPCINLRQSLGNITEHSFDEIWNTSSDNSEEVRNLKFKDLLDCPSCKHKQYCNRCSGIALMQGFSIKDHSPLDCMQAKAYSELYLSLGKV